MLYFIIVVLICLLYVHIKYYIDYSNTDHIYELDNISKSIIDNTTYQKYPVTFDYLINKLYSLENINIIDVSNNYNELYLNGKKALKLLDKSNYYTQYNDISNQIDDTIFKPIATIDSKYDILFGHKGISTKLSSDYAYRNILVIIDGSIDIKLVHPKYSYLLNEQLNCKHLVRESNCNIWNNKTIKHKSLYLEKGKALSIPIYWWWSIKFGTSAKVLQFKYYTLMNKIVILPILTQILLNN